MVLFVWRGHTTAPLPAASGGWPSPTRGKENLRHRQSPLLRLVIEHLRRNERQFEALPALRRGSQWVW